MPDPLRDTSCYIPVVRRLRQLNSNSNQSQFQHKTKTKKNKHASELHVGGISRGYDTREISLSSHRKPQNPPPPPPPSRSSLPCLHHSLQTLTAASPGSEPAPSSSSLPCLHPSNSCRLKLVYTNPKPSHAASLLSSSFTIIITCTFLTSGSIVLLHLCQHHIL